MSIVSWELSSKEGIPETAVMARKRPFMTAVFDHLNILKMSFIFSLGPSNGNSCCYFDYFRVIEPSTGHDYFRVIEPSTGHDYFSDRANYWA